MTESQRLLNSYVKRQIQRDRALMVTRIHALPIYDFDFVAKAEVLALFTTAEAGSHSPESDSASTAAAAPTSVERRAAGKESA